MAHKYLGEILIDEGLLSPDVLEQALKKQKKQLGEILLEMECIDPADLDRALEIQSKGRTRAQVYAIYLRMALGALALVTALACWALVSILADMRFEEELKAGKMSATRILDILKKPGHTEGVRLEALRSVEALTRGDEKAVVLRAALLDPAWPVRLIALQGVRKLGTRTSAQDVVPLLLDPETAVQEEAHRVLMGLTGEILPLDFKAWFQWAKDQGMKPEQPPHLKGK